MVLPINGRIAIVDDDYKQALPIIQALARKQIPCIYYDSSLESLPDEGKSYNDIRLLFLDINLIDNTTKDRASIKSKLIGVLRRIISPTNYPYLLVYWSRHEAEDKALVEGIFKEELKDRAPIGYVSASKSDYISLGGSFVDEAPTIDDLFIRVKAALNTIPVYTYLLQWENLVHKAADLTVQEIFSNTKSGDEWRNHAETLINLMGMSFVGKDTFTAQEPCNKIASSLLAFTNVFQDSLEYSINSCTFENAEELKPPPPGSDTSTLINFKLFFAQDCSPNNYSGSIIEISGEDEEFEVFLGTKVLKAQNKSDSIKADWKKIWMCVTPLCDVVNDKQYMNKYIRGLIVRSEYKVCFFDNEALFFSPPFKENEQDWRLVLDFRHFLSFKNIPTAISVNVLYRAKQHLFAEIQSVLARHINRQGILFLGKR